LDWEPQVVREAQREAQVPHWVDVHVGKMLRLRRELRGMPQKELARRLGISFQQVQKYESGANRISASKLWEMCCILDTEPNYYFEGLTRPHGGKMPVPGVGEPEQTPYQNDAASSRQVIELNQNFQQIHDVKIRRRLVQLIKTLAGLSS
jgi:transcriptional regulator with XRE-family HTH domain